MEFRTYVHGLAKLHCI